MKKLLACMLMVFFLSPISVISTEKSISFPSTTIHQLSQNVLTSSTYFNAIPKNPNVYDELQTYSDQSLTIPSGVLKPNDDFKINNLLLNQNNLPIFQLANGQFIEANKKFIYEDETINQTNLNSWLWLQKDFTIYEEPLVKGVLPINSDLKPYSKVHVIKLSQTQQGNFYYIENKGWVSEKYLSKADNRMVKVQEMLSQKYNKENYSIFVKQLTTQTSAGINADKLMYSASIAKLATLYYVQNKIETGKTSLNQTLKYTDQVNHFKGDYDPSGSGKLPKTSDNENYTVDDLLKAVAQHSDNVATNILGYYLANQYDKDFSTQMTAISGINWDMEERILSSKAAANVMESIYYQNGPIVSYLTNTDFDNQRISKNIAVPVAHKIGDAYDYKHDVAIVYSDSPFILSIFSENASYDDITAIADDIYSILK